MLTPIPDPAGLYVHVPFCRRKCPYCAFFSETELVLIPEWLTALQWEMALYQDFAPFFDTVYLGGGTPSLLASEDLAILISRLFQNFRIASDAEITLEANPEDLTLDKMQTYRQLGINRLSLGVQSFAASELAFLGRRHDAAQTVRALVWARKVGFANVSLDLIYGLPGQTLKEWEGNLRRALDFQPEHVSCYQLTVAPGSLLACWQVERRFRPLSEEAEREFFLFTAQFLEDRGYLHYEVSNFARSKEYRSRHNLKYWHHIPYLGLGPGAHSYKAERRWWNPRSVRVYCQALKAGKRPVAGEESLTPQQLHLEALFLGLRTKDGVALQVVRQGLPREEVLQEALAAGWLTIGDERVLPTREGLVLADRLALMLTE